MVPKDPWLEMVTLRSKAYKGYLKVQGWQRVPKQRSKVGKMHLKGQAGQQGTLQSNVGKGNLKIQGWKKVPKGPY